MLNYQRVPIVPPTPMVDHLPRGRPTSHTSHFYPVESGMAIPGSHPANQSAGSGAADPQRPGELENHWKITEKTMGRPAFLDGSWILEQFPREDADEDLI